ncbi:MAG: fumarate reductase subunit D [Gemmatimonadetes bacterium]|nr:fumarate reductase subunit D [Gemmatimonadota bacterium]
MSYKQDKTEPFWWGLFSAGGVVAAMLIPVLIYFVGLAEPLGSVGVEVSGYEAMSKLLSHPLARVLFFGVVVLPLYHAAHRIRFMLHEFGLRKLILPIHYFCYGGAIVGTGLAAYILFYLF